jgi:hypothetical protein
MPTKLTRNVPLPLSQAGGMTMLGEGTLVAVTATKTVGVAMPPKLSLTTALRCQPKSHW